MEDLKTLIVGAGVAGLTCAGLLIEQGIEPVVIEKEKKESFNHSGYMLGLLPLGGRVMNELNARTDYFAKSIQMESYEIHHSNGEPIKKYPLDFINENYGSYRGISRIDLIDILLRRCKGATLKFGTTVTDINRKPDSGKVTFSDGTTEKFDLVIIADGLHSHTRDLLLGDNEYAYYDTGWGGWVTWLNDAPTSSYKEYWGNGLFLGLYPVKDKIGIFLGGPVDDMKAQGLGAFRSEVKENMDDKYELPKCALQAFDAEQEPFFWQFQDCRSETWFKDNVVLLGDAATGFLPTAGVGASMAMDSAAALADELSRADRDHLNYCLKLYTQRQKERVERVQKDSRSLGKMMFIDSFLISKIRDEILPFYSLQRLLTDLTKVLEGK